MSNNLMLPAYAEKHRHALEKMTDERREFVLNNMKRTHDAIHCSTGYVHANGSVTVIDRNGNGSVFTVDD